jgi:imidazolonepropionase-like amidohydrolase
MSVHDHVLINARVFPATGGSVIEQGAVWISGNGIRWVGAQRELPALPGDCEILDAAGRFVMPGMTETHAHLSFADAIPFAIGATPVEEATITAVRNAALMLASGFTSAISFGSTHRIDVALRDAIDAGRIAGPRLLAAGRDLGATASNVDGDGALSQIADGPWALRRAVREQRRARVDVVKIFLDGEAINPVCVPGELSFCDEEVAAVVDEAHRRGMRVACHARSAAAVKQAVRAGVDFIGHANYLDDEAVALLAAARERVFVGPAIAWEVQYLAQHERLGVSKETIRKQGYRAEVDATIASVARLRREGVPLVVGGDYGISIAPHGSYARDLEYFVELFGMSPAEALLCATRNGGRAFDPSGALGTLEPGTLADLLVVDGDPLSDVAVLQDHARLAVMKDGLWCEAANR